MKLKSKLLMLILIAFILVLGGCGESPQDHYGKQMTDICIEMGGTPRYSLGDFVGCDGKLEDAGIISSPTCK